MKRFAVNGRFLTQPLTGVQRVARELCKAFARNPATAEMLLLIPPGVEGEADALGLPFRVAGRTADGPLRGALWENRVLPKVLEGRVLLNLANRAPLVPHAGAVLIHDAHVFDLPETYNAGFRLAYRLLYGQAVRNGLTLVTVSRFSRERLARALATEASRWTVIPNGGDHLLEVEPDGDVLARHGLPAGEFVLAVSTPTSHKNPEILSEVARLLASEGLPLVLVGDVPPGVYAPSSTPRGITLLGRVSDGALRALYENAGCFVFPSRYEGFGLPPLEAMSLGCPVAASDLPPLRESCGGASLFFDPDDPGNILASIRRLLGDPRRRRNRIRAGRERARELTWDRAAARWLELLDSSRLFGEGTPA